MISASLSLVSQALAQGVSTKQKAGVQQGTRGAKGNRQEAPDGSQCLSVYTQVYTSAFGHLVLRWYTNLSARHTQTHKPTPHIQAQTKTHKHNDNKKTQKQPVPTMKQMYKTAFCASAVAVAVDATKIYSLRLTLMREHTRTL